MERQKDGRGRKRRTPIPYALPAAPVGGAAAEEPNYNEDAPVLDCFLHEIE